LTENEESQTVAKVFSLSSNVQDESSYLSFYHMSIQKCKTKEYNLFIAKICNLHLTQAFSTHSFTRLDLPRMPNQGGGSSFRSLPLHV
jgi:hypothetical protein